MNQRGAIVFLQDIWADLNYVIWPDTHEVPVKRRMV